MPMCWHVRPGRIHVALCAQGLPWREVAAQAEALLARVHLEAAAHLRSGSYSGGMKRRLSVAIALLGMLACSSAPLEPTTGMDPISRRQVWDCIEDAKQGADTQSHLHRRSCCKPRLPQPCSAGRHA